MNHCQLSSIDQLRCLKSIYCKGRASFLCIVIQKYTQNSIVSGMMCHRFVRQLTALHHRKSADSCHLPMIHHAEWLQRLRTFTNILSYIDYIAVVVFCLKSHRKIFLIHMHASTSAVRHAQMLTHNIHDRTAIIQKL